jgi:hypothetical protein
MSVGAISGCVHRIPVDPVQIGKLRVPGGKPGQPVTASSRRAPIVRFPIADAPPLAQHDYEPE